MHDSLAVHVFQSWQKTKHELFYFLWGKVSIILLDFMEQLSSSKKFQDNVDRVIWLVYSLEFKNIIVRVKAEFSHYGKLVN